MDKRGWKVSGVGNPANSTLVHFALPSRGRHTGALPMDLTG